MAFLIGGANSLTGGYNIDNSLRFAKGDTAYMTNATGGTSTLNTKMTLSFWTKLGNNGYDDTVTICYAYVDTNNIFGITMYQDKIIVYHKAGGTALEKRSDSIRYRDPSAWYHIVVAVDTTQGTAANRIKMYVNGVAAEIDAGDDAAEDATIAFTQNVTQIIGASWSGSAYQEHWDGYFSEFYCIDGLAYDADDFGETDEDSGIWKPKDAKNDLTFGNNGFYLEFKNSAVGTGASDTIGADTSGEDQHFTSVNVAVTDQTTDTPTNNFCTLNPLTNSEVGNAPTFAEGNLKITIVNFDTESVMATMGVMNGKWYWEVKDGWKTGNWGFGIEKGSSSNIGFNVGYTATSYSFSQDGWKQNNSSASQIDSGLSDGDIIGYALDLDNGHFNFSQNGVWYNGSASESTTFDTGNHDFTSLDFGSEFVMPTISGFADTSVTTEINFGNPSYANSSSVADANGYGNFEYAPPSGYYALCTKNLAEFG